MKTEITLENKEKFFTQYWGQKVITNDNLSSIGVATYVNGTSIILEYLLLKPLSSITDEDAIEVARIAGYTNVVYDMRKKKSLIRMVKDAISNHILTYKIVDYLRSKGYALPWMGLSVEEMIDAGWIKLIE